MIESRLNSRQRIHRQCPNDDNATTREVRGKDPASAILQLRDQLKVTRPVYTNPTIMEKIHRLKPT